VNISVCPDVVSLRGLTNNGKLGQFSCCYDAFVRNDYGVVDKGDKNVHTRGLILFLSS